MRIFYFVHITGTDSGISGVPRVVRNLARELAGMVGVEFVPVCWRHDFSAIVHAEQRLLDNLSRHGGPALSASGKARQPVEPSPGDWLLIAEVPHLQSHFADYASVHLDEIVGYAVQAGLKAAIVFHDILPLIFGVGGKAGRIFVELSPAELSSRSQDAEQLAFSRYAHATALVDLVLPVSRTAGDTLRAWLIRHGCRAERLPPIAPLLLPEEVFGEGRVNLLYRPQRDEERIEFVAIGFVSAQKNQLMAMAAFLDLIERRPDLDLYLHLVGLIDPQVAVAASLMAKRAKGRIVLHGRLPDARIRELTRRSRATLFVSLGEGFGLPVAESLWRGKPCLSSNSGSIAEIARGGGCLPVNPRSLDAISSGIETLATDAERYRELLQEIAARSFKTWDLYARQLVDALASGRVADFIERNAPTAAERLPDAKAGEREAVLLILAEDWLIPDAYSAPNRSRSLFYGGAINYDAERDAAVDEQTLFFGPYIPLPAGRYSVTLDGELEGELRLSFTAEGGSLHLVETTVTFLGAPIVFELPRAVERFEIVGARTPQLRSLALRCAIGELRACRGEPEVAKAADKPSLRLVPAAGMRTPDAYKSGHRNRLRDGAAIAFDLASHAGVKETTLFFGPYIRLETGRYSIRFVGELQGSLNLRLTRDHGRDCLRELILSDFDAPVVLELAEPANNFEAVGARTQDTRAMRLESIEIAAVPDGAEDDDKGREMSKNKTKGSLLARVLGRA
jgi:glycosyltransferase involved in cell wall biosynthesis